MRIRIEWQVEDGYVGGARPQETEIDVDKEEWEEMNEEQKQEFLEEEVQQDFDQKIGFGIDRWEVNE